MNFFSVISVLFISRSVFADDDSLLVSCDTTDIECLSRSTAKFLERTHRGMPEHDIRSIDPLMIPSHSVTVGDNIKYTHTNLNVTGLKDQDISDFKLDLETKSAVLTTKSNITAIGDVEVTFLKKSKTFSGPFQIHGSTLTTASYGTELKKDDKGVLHFEVGPETITCKVVTTPEIKLSPDLLQSLANDEDVKKISNEKKEEARATAFCSIVEESYKTVIHNIRVTARLLPASAFFKNIKQ